MGTPVYKLEGATSYIHSCAMFDVKLALLMLAGTTALIEAQKPCCYSKKMMGKTYTLMESNSKEVAAYGCDTANDCIYKEEETSDRYCFKMGGQEEPVCLQELPTCTKYFAKHNFNNMPVQPKIDTLIYTLADNNTCTPPAFPDYPKKQPFKSSKLIASGGDLMVFDDSASGPRQKSVMKIEAGSWKEIQFNETTGFPDNGYVILPWKKDLYLVGGYKGSPNGHQASVFKSVNGYTWEKLPWELKSAQSELKACITTNADSGHANLVSFGGLGRGKTDAILKIYDIEDPNPATDGYMEIPTKGFAPEDQSNRLVCHDGWVHVAASSYDQLFSLKLSSSAEFKKVDYDAHSESGTLMVYQNKVGIAGGMTMGNPPKEQTKFFYFDTTSESLKEGSEFPWYKESKDFRIRYLVSVGTM